MKRIIIAASGARFPPCIYPLRLIPALKVHGPFRKIEGDQMPPAEKREIVEAITNKIEAGKNELVLDLCYLPSEKDIAHGWRKGRVLCPFCHIELSALRKDCSEFFAVWQSLGTLVYQKRVKLTLSAVECAELLSVSRKTLNNWENGDTKPDRALLPKIVKFIGFDPFGPKTGASLRRASTLIGDVQDP
jgi:DNA-binding XRE family transcriptional regulator